MPWTQSSGAITKSPVVEFWSSVEFDSFMETLVAGLRRIGTEARTCFEVSSKDYRAPHSPVGRAWLRARMYASYPARLFFRCAMSRQQRIRVVCSNTFYAPLVAALAHGRSPSNVIHLVYDLFPDALIETEKLTKGSAPARFCDALVRRTFRSAAANVFLGDRLLAHARSRFGPIPN